MSDSLGVRVMTCRKCPDRSHNLCMASGDENLIYQECCRVGYCPKARFGKGSDDPTRKSGIHKTVFAEPPTHRGGLSWLMHGALGLAKAAVGIDPAPEDVQEWRRGLCLKCDHAVIEEGQLRKCHKCGCKLAPKISLAGESCPVGVWPRVGGSVAYVQSGRAGDILLLIPALKWLADRGVKVTLVCDDRYSTICDRYGWMRQFVRAPGPNDPWNAPREYIKRFDSIRVTTVGNNQPAQREGTCFARVQWERTGCPWELFDKLPLDLGAARNYVAEDALAEQWLEGETRPVVLYNFSHFNMEGRPAAFQRGKDLVGFLEGRFPDVRFFDLGAVRAPRIVDLMGLYERSAMLINHDCGTLHLGAAKCHSRLGKPTPTVGLVLDDAYRAAPRRPHWLECLTYAQAGTPEGFERIADAVWQRLKPATVNIDLEPIQPDVRSIEVLEPDIVHGNLELIELQWLCGLVKEMQPRAIVEIGTFDGRTALNLAKFSTEGATVHTITLPPGASPKLSARDDDMSLAGARPTFRYLKYPDLAAKIVQVCGDSADYEFPGVRADLVFVDGAHSAAYMANDTGLARRMLNPGGVIVWHDYNVPEVRDYLDTLSGSIAGIRKVNGTTLVYWRSDQATFRNAINQARDDRLSQ